MGPLDLLFGWQSLIVAVAVYMLTQAVKAVANQTMGGKEERKKKVWVTRVILPALPPLIGAILAAFISVHPQSILDYVSHNELGAWEARGIFALWGAACGQFSDYMYSKAKGLVEDVKGKKEA